MDPRRTVDSTTCLQAEGDVEPLWVQRANSPTGPLVLSVWEPTPEERAAISLGSNIELAIWGLSQPPVALHVTNVELGKNPDMVE